MAAQASSSRDNLPDISSCPHQPTVFSLPKRSFGKKKVVLRSFQASRFRQWLYLHYNEARDLVYCHTCVMGFKEYVDNLDLWRIATEFIGHSGHRLRIY